jgi:signal transduction histidine kinase
MIILLLDDEQSFIDDFCEEANEQGYEVIAYLSAREVWRNLESVGTSDRPDICFVDYQLSNNVKGTDFIKELRQRGFLFPVVLLTHYDDPQIAFEAGASGATTFCQKDNIISSPDSLSKITEQTINTRESMRDSSIRRAGQTYEGMKNFIAEFIHDIKDVMIPIQNSSQMAIEGIDTDLSSLLDSASESLKTLLDELNTIRKEAIKGEQYLIDLFNKIHIEIGVIKIEHVHIRDFIDKCCQQFVKSNRVVSVNTSLEVVFFDSSIVERILKHLLTNLEKHVPSDIQADILVSSHGEGPISTLRIVVRDYGPGIPLELMETIFRLGVVKEEKPGNMGLGLSIAKNLAESYILQDVRGALSCVNLPNSPGARFDLEIPVSEVL